MSNAIGIVGIDGHSPLYAPDARWMMFDLNQIYRGGVGLNKHIPKVRDWVVEPETGTVYLVASLDPISFVPDLVPLPFGGQQGSVGSDLETVENSYRLYYDKSVSRYTITPDAFIRTYDPDARFARIYRGSDIDPTKIISRRYDNSGNFIGHDIPLTLVAYNNADNNSIRSIPSANCDVELMDGELCTIVIFNAASRVSRKILCIVDETTAIAPAYAEQRYVTSIFLKSVFVENTMSMDINYPVNLPIPSFTPIGVVQYNDTTQVEYPVDGTKFKLDGLDQFTSTIIGHRVPLVLRYRLDPTEAAVATVSNDGQHVVRPYNLVVSKANRSYNVKMYVYPVWVDELNGYRYRVYLTNLDRNMLYDISNVVGLATNSQAFNPLAYGITQRLTFSVDLSRVSGVYDSYIHVQTVDIVLRGSATDPSVSTPWEVSSQVPTSKPYYGTGLVAIRNNLVPQKVYIGNNIATVDQFIDRVYKPTDALFNPEVEIEPPRPTHIEVIQGSNRQLVPIADYNDEFIFSTPVQQYGNVDIVFYKETVTGMLKLSIASMLVR